MSAFWRDVRRRTELPEFNKARTALERADQGLCKFDQCVEFRDPETGEYIAGWGPVGCQCQDES